MNVPIWANDLYSVILIVDNPASRHSVAAADCQELGAVQGFCGSGASGCGSTASAQAGTWAMKMALLLALVNVPSIALSPYQVVVPVAVDHSSGAR